jgi:hypothetical protein
MTLTRRYLLRGLLQNDTDFTQGGGGGGSKIVQKFDTYFLMAPKNTNKNLYNKRQCPRQQNNQQQQLFLGREFFRENFLSGIFLMKSFLPKSSLAS